MTSKMTWCEEGGKEAKVGGLFLATAKGDRPRSAVPGKLLRFAWAGQAGLQHQGVLATGKATGLGRKGIVVFPNDVHLLALLLRRSAAQSLQLGAVIPVRPAWSAGGARRGSGAVTGAPRWCRRCVGAVGAFAWLTWRLSARTCGWTPRAISLLGWSGSWLLQLHELTGRDRFTHAARTAGAPWT